ncbi:MAG TPA: aminotransferase class V-fold PLP-dependent enzyme [Acidimicrobiales bacterium]|nr:aminotransferase class V-fold PLP-dependent enzyme [Acidimicrobiales bacterium]
MVRYYLDHASTTPLRPEASAAMSAWRDSGITADPGRVHTEGRIARATLEDARDQVAEFFGVRPRQVVFTSGGTEAINAAVWGAARARPGPMLCAAVEHSAVRDASARSGPVLGLDVDRLGRIHPDTVTGALAGARAQFGQPVSLVQCQWANHEVGTVQPVPEVIDRCRQTEAPVLVHVDAVAAAGHVPCDLGALDADLVSVSAHKLGGPPGIGALVVRRGLRIEPFLVGGEQERARRAGFENVAAAVGFAAAVTALAGSGTADGEEAAARRLAGRLREAALAVPGVTEYGDTEYEDTEHRVPHIVCLGVEGVEAEPVLLGLDQAGIAVHSGSSCSSESLEPSPVLEAMGVDADRSLRLSVGWSTSDADVDAFAAAFPRVVADLRALRSA